MNEALLRNLLREWIAEDEYAVTEIDEFVNELDALGLPIPHRDICHQRWESRLAGVERVAPDRTDIHEKYRAVLTALDSIPPTERLYYWSAQSATRDYSGVACARGIIVFNQNPSSTRQTSRPSAQAMNLAVLPQQVLLAGHDLLKLMGADRFLACFGQPSREREIPIPPDRTRVAMVWDGLGLVAYEDRPKGLMSHLYLAFRPERTPERPSQSSHSIISINGGLVTAETSEHTLPRNGPTPISVDDGKHFFYEADLYSIGFQFERRPNVHGPQLIVGRLESCSFSWRQPPA